MTRVRPLLALLLAALALLAPAQAKKPQGAGVPDDWGAPSAAAGGERILSFVSDLAVGADGTLHVTETIRVNAEGRQINHGITRDFPTRYERDGHTVRVGFEVEGIERDGRPEPYERERADNGVLLRIGDADVELPPGEHVYVIRYATTRQLGFFDTYDELYWNVTGLGSNFPIDRAEARIRLPQAVAFGQRRVYTGPEDSRAEDAEVASERPGEIAFRTTRPLGPHEGLTVAVAWPKGVVAAPALRSAAARSFEDYGPIGAAILALIGLAAFYFYAWKRAGRGPVAGTIVPIFAPPDGLSAAATRYVRRMGFDNRAFAAAIVESGVKGKLRLEEGEKGWFSAGTTTIHRTGDEGDMPAPERNMLRALFAGGASIEMDKANHLTFGAARTALKEGLEQAYYGKLFLNNLGWAWVGVVLMLAAMLFIGTVMALADPYAELGERALPALGFALLIGAVWAGNGSRLAVSDGSILRAALAILLGVGGSVGVVMAFALAIENEGARIVAMAAPLLALPLVLSAFRWMAAPTREGRAVMDRIAGFEHYLSITEEERLEALHPPEKTPELFERYLPYAIALEVENRWAERFADVLAAAAAEPDRQTGMGWYVGSTSPWSNPGMFATAVGGSLASSVAAAATAPGSSSGSGGGGSSGGGGGGGGVGGW